MNSFSQRHHHATGSKFRRQPFRKKIQPYRAIIDFSVNEHLKNKFFRNKVAQKSLIQTVPFGCLYFHSGLKTVLGRRETKILKYCMASERGRVRASEQKKTITKMSKVLCGRYKKCGA